MSLLFSDEKVHTVINPPPPKFGSERLELVQNIDSKGPSFYSEWVEIIGLMDAAAVEACTAYDMTEQDYQQSPFPKHNTEERFQQICVSRQSISEYNVAGCSILCWVTV